MVLPVVFYMGILTQEYRTPAGGHAVRKEE